VTAGSAVDVVMPHPEVLSRCDICTESALRRVDPVAQIDECARCAFRFVNPRPTQSDIVEAYSQPDFYETWLATEAGREKMWRKRLRRLPRLARGARVLDIGAGVGTFLALARDEAGWDVSGTEVSRQAVQLARRRHGLELMVGQFEQVSVPAASFDLITLWHVLEHVPSPSRLLQACHRALVPGGWLVVAVPNDGGARWRVEQARSLLRRRKPIRYRRLAPGAEIHLSHFSQPVLAQLLHQNGFVATTWSIDDHYPNPQFKTNMLVRSHRAMLRLTGFNFGQTIFSVSQLAAAGAARSHAH
jgi:2-polyprenyl-3-methyl-5-hydroxy-6-metoxy-1,4-benzoquinol methylase